MANIRDALLLMAKRLQQKDSLPVGSFQQTVKQIDILRKLLQSLPNGPDILMLAEDFLAVLWHLRSLSSQAVEIPNNGTMIDGILVEHLLWTAVLSFPSSLKSFELGCKGHLERASEIAISPDQCRSVSVR